MIQKDGTSVKSVWYYSQNNIDYEENDIIIAKSGQRRYIGVVTTAFNSSNVTPAQALSNYCRYPAGASDLITEQGVMERLNKTLRYFSIKAGVDGGLTTLNNRSITIITNPGLYKVYANTTGLPASFYQESYSPDAYLRVSVTVEDPNKQLFELFCFNSGRYFAGVGTYGNAVSWKEFTPNGIGIASQELDNKLSTLSEDVTRAEKAIDNCQNALRYRYNTQSTLEEKEGTKYLDLFCDNQVSYLVNARVIDSYQESVGVTKTFDRKYTFRVDPNDPENTVYDKYGTFLKTNITDYVILKFNVTPSTEYSIKGFQQNSIEGAIWARFLNSAGLTIKTFTSSQGANNKTVATSAETVAIEVVAPLSASSSYGVYSNNTRLPVADTIKGIAKKSGSVSLRLAAPANINFSSIYEIL